MNYYPLTIKSLVNILNLVSVLLLSIGVVETADNPLRSAATSRGDAIRVLPSIVTHLGNKVICREGWAPARTTADSGPRVSFVCVKLYRQSADWEKAQDVCRADNAFLLKMEKRIAVSSNYLDAILKNEGIHSVWTGLHIDETKLIWDEMKPKLFQPRLGTSKVFGILKRGWRWVSNTFDDVSDSRSCGLYSIGTVMSRVKREAVKENPVIPKGLQKFPPGLGLPQLPMKLTDPDTPLSEKMSDVLKELQDEDKEDGPNTTPSPPLNVTESTEETTEATSKEDTTDSISIEHTSKTSKYNQTTTVSTLIDDGERSKRSTMQQQEPVTTIQPPTTQTSKSVTKPLTSSTTQTDTMTSTQFFTRAPTPTANLPAKGTSIFTSPTSLFTETTDGFSSAEVTEPSIFTTDDYEAPDDEDRIKTSASTLPEKPSSSESQIANPIFFPDPGRVPSIFNQLDTIKPLMGLEDCEEEYPYICYSDPIEELHPDPHCGHGWMSHNYLDKCYRVVETPLIRSSAASNCYNLGGRLADAFHEFYGNITAMAFAMHPRKNMLGTHAWIEHRTSRVDPADVQCDAITGYEVDKVNCATKLASICEKPVPDSAVRDYVKKGLTETKGFEEFLDASDKLQVLYMTSTKPGTLICPLVTSSPEDMILWYKDGILIKDFDSVFINNQFRLTSQNRFSGSLKLDITLFQRLEENKDEHEQRMARLPSMLQGKYWCEVWRRKPFQKIKSKKYLVRYTDVITLFGTVQTKGINATDAALFNLMDREVGIPRRILLDLSYMNSNITLSMSSANSLFNNVASELYNIDHKTGRVEFHTYITLSQDRLPETYKSKMVASYLQHLNTAITANSRAISQHWNVPPKVSNYIFISRTDVCQRKYLKDEVSNIGAHFPTTSINTTSKSEEECNGKPSGTAECVGNLEKRAYWTDWLIDRSCQRVPEKPTSDEYVEIGDGFNTDEIEYLNGPSIIAPIPTANPGLAQLDQIEIEEENAEDVSDKMVEIMDHADILTEEDVTRISKVIERINIIPKPNVQVGKNLVKTLNKVLEAKEKVLNDAEKDDQSATKIIANMEEIANKAELGKQKRVRMVTPNVAMEIWDLEKEDEEKPVIGLGAMVADSWSVALSDTRIKTIVNRTDLHEFDVAIELPESLVSNNIKKHNKTRLSMFIYKKVGLFATNDRHVEVNSPIISASVGGEKIQGLEEKIRMIFRPFQDKHSRSNISKCVYWEFSMNNNRGGWSNQGCEYAGSLNDRDICLCDHLTNFAVLLDFYGQTEQLDPIHDFTLSIITIIGLSLSIFGLGMTIVTFIFFSKLRQGRAQQTLFHMALSLLGAELVFLIGIRQIDYYGVCLTVAILLHYFILVSFMWMLVEAVLQYLTFVKVLGTYISRYTLKTAIPAWGIPLIPVCIVLGIDYTLYKGWDTYCWMDLNVFYYAFALPVGCIIIFNIIMFIIIIISLGRRPRGLRAHHGKSNSTSKTNLKAAMTIFVLLGLTWGFGYLAIADARLVFQYIFTFLSSLQGFFIFILMVARRKQIRDQWAIICCRNGGEDRKRKSVSATNSNSTSSNSSGGSGASRRSLYKNKCRNGSIETIISDVRFESLYYIPTSSIPTKNLNYPRNDTPPNSP